MDVETSLLFHKCREHVVFGAAGGKPVLQANTFLAAKSTRIPEHSCFCIRPRGAMSPSSVMSIFTGLGHSLVTQFKTCSTTLQCIESPLRELPVELLVRVCLSTALKIVVMSLYTLLHDFRPPIRGHYWRGSVFTERRQPIFSDARYYPQTRASCF